MTALCVDHGVVDQYSECPVGLFQAFDFTRSQVWVMGAFFSILAYGVVLLLFLQTAYTLVHQARHDKSGRHWLFLMLSIIMFVFSTIFVAIVGVFLCGLIGMLQSGLVNDGMTWFTTIETGLVVFVTSNFLMDGLLVRLIFVGVVFLLHAYRMTDLALHHTLPRHRHDSCGGQCCAWSIVCRITR